MQRKTFSGRLNHRILLCRIIPGYNPKAVITKKRHLDSHRSTVTTQTQNKTRQNYYAIFLLCRGGIFTDSYIFAYLQVAIRRFAYIKHSDFYFVHERRSKNVISSPCSLSGSLPSAIWRVPDDWNSSPTDADRTYSGYYPTPQRRKRE